MSKTLDLYPDFTPTSVLLAVNFIPNTKCNTKNTSNLFLMWKILLCSE